jgi:hypothetical protein
MRGSALCDFQHRDGGRLATNSPRQFDALPDAERCKECSKKLARLRVARESLR